MQRARALFRVKAEHAIACSADVSVSTAERWARGERDMHALDLLMLIHDRRIGPEMLRVFWEHVPEATRAVFMHQLELEKKRKAIAERRRTLRAQLEEAEAAEAELNLGGHLVQPAGAMRAARF
jgi:transcriptional regulator with XRE-family HTH domain